MPDLLNIATSGMLAFQRSLDTTGHNIANANTPGYSRQTSEFQTLPGQASGAGYIGNGVKLSTISRVYDQFLGLQLQSSVAGQSRLQTMDSLAGRIDGLLANGETGLGPAMQSFFDALQTLNNNPASLPARQALIGEAETFVQRLGSVDAQLRGLDREVNVRMTESVGEVNRLAEEIAELNGQISLAEGSSGQKPNDLLDRRDALLAEIASHIKIATAQQEDGSINIFVGNGQSLVVGRDAQSLATVRSDFDPTRQTVVFRTALGDTEIPPGSVGGALGGLLEFREQLLDPTRHTLGETALALSFGFNQQHAAGMDLAGNLGGAFFDLPSPTVSVSQRNAGTGLATASYTDIDALDGTDYLLTFNGVGYDLTRSDTGQAVPMTGAGTGADPFVANGLSIVVSGTPSAGDELLLRTTSNVAEGLSVSVSDPKTIAVAAPTRLLIDAGNLGDGVISQPEVVDAGDAALLTTTVIEFTAPNTYSVNGAGAFAYTSGNPITINGSQFSIAGVPAVGDRFTLEANTGGQGDNRNGLAMSDLQTGKVLRGGTVTLSENYAGLVANVGNGASRIQSNLQAQTIVLENIESSIAAKSGVNLDEEAANLLRFQQAYQAMARVVAVTNDLFDTLLSSVRS